MNYQVNTQMQAAAPIPVREVHAKWGDLQESLGNLDNAVNILEDRLGCVMAPPAPEPTTNAKGIDAPICEVANYLYQGQTHAATLTRRVQSMIDRLKV